MILSESWEHITAEMRVTRRGYRHDERPLSKYRHDAGVDPYPGSPDTMYFFFRHDCQRSTVMVFPVWQKFYSLTKRRPGRRE